MCSNTYSQNLTSSFLEDQDRIAKEQYELVKKTTSLEIRNVNFYSKTLTSLAICNELILGNIQLKELNYFKIKMLRAKISEISIKIENFRNLLKAFTQKFNSDKL